MEQISQYHAVKFKIKSKKLMSFVLSVFPNGRFAVVIFQQVWALFTTAPEVNYKDSTVCMTGQVMSYNDKPQIVVNSPKQIAGNISDKALEPKYR